MLKSACTPGLALFPTALSQSGEHNRSSVLENERHTEETSHPVFLAKATLDQPTAS